jgi:alpha-1,3-mannosyltransferase
MFGSIFKLIFHPNALLMLDIFLCAAILMFVPYTEIDWKAYMQEVGGFISGEYDYLKLKGDTGPLVYPAGFVYFYTALYYITSLGKDILLAQLIFALFYIINQSVVFRLYKEAGVTGAILVALMTSKRIHSLFLLRMFNDCVAIALCYLAIYLFTRKNLRCNWALGCVVYSLAVSIKMNIFLFAPGLLLILLKNHRLPKVVGLLSICALVQVVLAAPFVAHNWKSYVLKAFELSRVFTYKWTVNYKFLPESVFVDPAWGMTLLLITLTSWGILYRRRWRHRDLSVPRNIILTLFESNCVGVICSRTMHYQFYVWFYHQLPLVLFLSCGKMPTFLKISILMTVEFGFNKYPSSAMSSAALMSALALTLLFMLTDSDQQQKPKAVAGAAKSRASGPKDH